ncbi:hypothetical protein AALN73_12710 [Bacteroides stercorirosoris]|jgi:hypothetical protein|uniref:hypothetical protein n=1 Tax=Bacteroides stercorirosoris TaxID=871324 RepID=UPI0035166D20
MTTDFFRMNLPYGMQKNEKGEWMFFNRQYKPLGCATTDFIADKDLVNFYSKYPKMDNAFLESLAEFGSVDKNEAGEITRIWFYSDATVPSLEKLDESRWNHYIGKLKLLASLRS